MFYKIDFGCDDKDELQSQLNQLYHYEQDWGTKIFHRSRINLFYLLMKTLVEQNVITSFDSALDIGCNAGVYSKIISDFGFRQVTGIDIVPAMIQRANDSFAFNNENGILAYTTKNAEEINTKNKYDFILCTEVIEHTDNPSKVIENIQAVLAPGGVAVVTLPNSVSIPYLVIYLRHQLRNKKMDKITRDHLKYPFYKSIRLFQDLRLIKTTGTNLFMIDSRFLRPLYRSPLFATVNRINFYLSRIWPLKYFSQFFFLVLKKDPNL